MKTKEEIVANWLPRYTKRNLEDFGEYILLTNFNKYVEIFAEKFNVPILGKDANMISCLLYTSPSPRDAHESRMPSSA